MRHRPVLIDPSEELPVTVDEVKRALRWDGDNLDDEIEEQIKAAVAHYQGWTGILGISLMPQTWRQDFDGFTRSLCLLVGPVLPTGMSVTWRNAAGQLATVDPSLYALRFDLGGQASVRFDRGYAFPSGLHESGAVSVTYLAGHDPVPDDIKSAIKVRVQLMMDEAAQVNAQHLERIEATLLRKYRRIRI